MCSSRVETSENNAKSLCIYIYTWNIYRNIHIYTFVSRLGNAWQQPNQRDMLLKHRKRVVRRHLAKDCGLLLILLAHKILYMQFPRCKLTNMCINLNLNRIFKGTHLNLTQPFSHLLHFLTYEITSHSYWWRIWWHFTVPSCPGNKTCIIQEYLEWWYIHAHTVYSVYIFIYIYIRNTVDCVINVYV